VTLGAFFLSKYEMTQGQWGRFTGTNPSNYGSGSMGDKKTDPRYPVDMVSWEDCERELPRLGLGLPTEAQWEYACRAGQAGPYSGTGSLDEMGWYGSNSEFSAHSVGTKAANQFGLHDMHGNVWEWCEDVYDANFYGTPEAAGPDPVSTSGSGYRVYRGGSWYSSARYCRSAYRHWIPPDFRNFNNGFRPLRPLP